MQLNVHEKLSNEKKPQKTKKKTKTQTTFIWWTRIKTEKLLVTAKQFFSQSKYTDRLDPLHSVHFCLLFQDPSLPRHLPPPLYIERTFF